MSEAAPADDDDGLADDLLQGAKPIARFMFGSDDIKQQRRIYWLTEHNGLPVFRIGQLICARKSTLREWIAKQEARGLSGDE